MIDGLYQWWFSTQVQRRGWIGTGRLLQVSCESRSSWRSKTCWGATGSEARRSPASNRDAVPGPTAHLKPRRLRAGGEPEPAGRVSRNAHWWCSHARAGWADSHATPTSACQWTPPVTFRPVLSWRTSSTTPHESRSAPSDVSLAPVGLPIIRAKQPSAAPGETAECVAIRSRRAGGWRDRGVAEALVLRGEPGRKRDRPDGRGRRVIRACGRRVTATRGWAAHGAPSGGGPSDSTPAIPFSVI